MEFIPKKGSSGYSPHVNWDFIYFYFKEIRRDSKRTFSQKKNDTVYSSPQSKEHKRCSFSDRVHAHPLIYAATVLYVNADHPWMPRPISQLPVPYYACALCIICLIVHQLPGGKSRKLLCPPERKRGIILYTSSQARLQCVLGRNSSWIKTALLFSDVVGTEVLGAAQTQEAAWLDQHGALCRLISPAKKSLLNANLCSVPAFPLGCAEWALLRKAFLSGTRDL